MIVKTAKNPLVNNCWRLFSNTFSLESLRLGVVGPSRNDIVAFTPELGVDWKVTRPVVVAEGVCGDVLGALVIELFVGWICGAFTVVERSNWFVTVFMAECSLQLSKWGTCGMCVIYCLKVMWLTAYWCGICINCSNCVTKAGNCRNRKLLVIFVGDFCFLIW